jgi:GH15 family glucan-1,4-alpha-glucosidase
MNKIPNIPKNAHQYNMGLVGNCNFSALIDTCANVQWLCWPRFDSDFIFGGLIAQEKGGSFSISSAHKNAKTRQNYLENTNILVTRFEDSDGVFEVTDFAPRFLLNERYHKPLMLFRKVRKIQGNPRIQVSCRPVGNYGTTIPETFLGSNHIRYDGLEKPVRLTTNAPLTYVSNGKPFALDGDLYFVLSWGIPLEGPLVSTFEDFFSRTKNYWRTWVEHCTVPKIFQKEVIRSALALKLHQFEDTGAIIAAPTTSLPEIEGESRNWDYRYCWLRDSYYTINAINSLGHYEEMEKYAHFIENLNMSSLPALQPVYCIDGSASMPEFELPLAGYRSNQPVRIGNGAALQIQHDGYGQILLSLYSLYTDFRLGERQRLSEKSVERILNYIEKNLETPDNGVWEFRGKQSVHAYSLLFHWAGSVAAIKIAKQMNNEALAERASRCQAKAAQLLESCYCEGKKAYAQALNSSELDASLLQMITLGYFHDKPKALAIEHLRAIQKDLEIQPGFLLRYKHKDDFGLQESAFLVCSFWYIEALIALDFVEEATELFEKVLAAQNHLGLISEDFDPNTASQWGNFPQTYSHVGLINCAFALDRALKVPSFLL